MFGWLGALFLMGITAVSFMAFVFSTNDVKRSIAGTSFISMTFAIFLRATNLLPDLGLYISLVVCAAALAFTWNRR